MGFRISETVLIFYSHVHPFSDLLIFSWDVVLVFLSGVNLMFSHDSFVTCAWVSVDLEACILHAFIQHLLRTRDIPTTRALSVSKPEGNPCPLEFAF